MSTRDNESILSGYSDADWAGDINDRKSTSVYLFMMSGAATSWKSRKQTCVALSTVEAEYVALASAAQLDETVVGRSLSQANRTNNRT